ncbi:hypothetical protein Ddye_019773 [Dipteronia dyeriana]|uniref:B3 domain-containing transcription repressor VAL1 n=1 Tax=Dipteronia dyeriana TaxID=168575 RepID=A0AAD9TZ09_9ROSI|nr:hypothetical protein Ddye_019773 [Dipteronia dyeriana]
MMGTRICMNALCGTGATREWKKGWPLRSGGYADLCFNCGSAYENLVFCETYHLEEPGWRECYLCRKRLHCGCIASKSMLELLDYGGVGCSACAMTSRLHSIQRDEIRNGFCALKINDADDLRSTSVENRVVGDDADEGKLTQLCRVMEANEPNFLHQSLRSDTSASLGQDKQEEVRRPHGEVGSGCSGAIQPYVGSPKFNKPDSGRSMLDVRDTHESAQPSLNMTLGVPSGGSNFVVPFSNGSTDGKEQRKASPPFQQGQRSRPILPKPPKYGLNMSSETNKGTTSQLRIARPPADGRGKNHLLPRYWPRITDQELQQLSGDLNSSIVPLFEKILSASDAGRIGRLVLPKACAEAYFPSISQSEGIPLRVQDVKGKEWMFQFRFWPNNNSRMYVLEGVTPCIQSMQLRAGDTITFSRLDPGGKLIMGFRKATNSDETQDTQTSPLPNGTPSGESSLSGTTQNLSTVNGYSGLSLTQKGHEEPHINALSEHLSLANGDTSWSKSANGGRTNEVSPQQYVPVTEKKRTRNIGSKSKRLLMNSDEAMELRLTWEEAQDLLRPPPSVKPSIVTIEDHEFEEYDEPPVFGKRTILMARLPGGQEQWAQCDDCSNWRKLPSDVLLPPKWTCSDNVWDSIRCSCSVPEEMSPKELENILRVSKDFKKRKIVDSHKRAPECESSGLDALASAAVLGDNAGDLGETSVGATTKHPRHRPGCTCIVCIQPPSGKGKHKSTCVCNVCLTVKRRFKTLMLRKKRRLSEREAAIAEIAQFQKDDNDNHYKGKSETNGSTNNEVMNMNHSEIETSQKRSQAEVVESSNGQIDLNCHPNREDMQIEDPGLSIMSLVDAANMPLENYMQPNGGGGLVCLSSCLLEQATGQSERLMSDEGFLASVGWVQNQEPNID